MAPKPSNNMKALEKALGDAGVSLDHLTKPNTKSRSQQDMTDAKVYNDAVVSLAKEYIEQGDIQSLKKVMAKNLEKLKNGETTLTNQAFSGRGAPQAKIFELAKRPLQAKNF